jgi:uncharacterized RDD family membrane protein YckC
MDTCPLREVFSMRDITCPTLMWLKAILFLVLGLLAGAMILIELPTLRIAITLVLCIWAFSRAYYFAFHVIEHYIDPSFRFAGLTSVASYLLHRRNLSAVARRRNEW